MIYSVRRALIAAFFLGLWLPLIATITGHASHHAKENPVALPHFVVNHESLKKYFTDLTQYYNQNFGARDALVHQYNKLLIMLFHVSPTQQVILGQHHWLYYDGPSNHFVDEYYRNVRPFTVPELEKLTHIFIKRAAWLKSQHVPYLIVIAPNKESIYPEYLPKSMKKIGLKSRTEQFVEYAKKHSDLHVLYLKDVLLAAKTKGERLYYKTDSHWNDLGAYYGYLAVVDELKRSLLPHIGRPGTFRFEAKTVHGRDLTNMLDLPKKFTEEDFFLNEKILCPKEWISSESKLDEGHPFLMVCPSHHQLSAVIFRDSFFGALLPFFLHHFDKMAVTWQYDFDRSLIKKEKPDIVVQEFVERSLDGIVLQPVEMPT